MVLSVTKIGLEPSAIEVVILYQFEGHQIVVFALYDGIPHKNDYFPFHCQMMKVYISLMSFRLLIIYRSLADKLIVDSVIFYTPMTSYHSK